MEFKAFLKKQNFNFDTETEIALKKTLEAAKKEKIDGTINSEYQQLLTALQKSEELQLNEIESDKLKTMKWWLQME